MPEDGAHISSEPENNGLQKDAKLGEEHVEHGASLEESRSRLLERIASEVNRLKFYVARAQVFFSPSTSRDLRSEHRHFRS